MKTLPKHLEVLLLQAVKASGTYAPHGTLESIEEYLTLSEYNLAVEFLSWVMETRTKFGHGNIQQRFQEFQEAKGKSNMKSRITLIGDIHGDMEQFHRILKSLPHGQRSLQIGDIGFGLCEIPEFPSRCKLLRGNHDDPVSAKAHKNYMGDFGYIYADDLFYISGASSIDKLKLTEDKTWWRDEEISISHLNKAVDLYELVKPGVVVSHECPTVANKALMKDKEIISSRTCQALQAMFEAHEPRLWIFGHYHISKEFKIGKTTFRCLNQGETFEIETYSKKISKGVG